jgi:hypothetical protein
MVWGDFAHIFATYTGSSKNPDIFIGVYRMMPRLPCFINRQTRRGISCVCLAFYPEATYSRLKVLGFF